jgi:tRNA pseudouridine65 synthase
VRERLEVIHRDERLIAVNKPSGIAVHRGWSDDEVNAMTLVRDAIGKHVFPVHRLDRATSGVLLFALDSECAAATQALFDRRAIAKRYRALVRGVAPESIDIDHPVPKSEDGPRVDARTQVARLFAKDRYSFVEARPETGRLHQIRRHLKHISHPIIGDVRYGKGEHNRYFREEHGLHRLALHALQLSLPHPISGVELVLRATLPDDFSAPLLSWGLPRELLEG